jgi:small subunit ribosomal protein S9
MNARAAEKDKNRWYATGRRKEAVARVWVTPGTGRIFINRREFENYLPRETSRLEIIQALEVSEQVGKVDLLVNVRGGGPTGQAGAIRHGLSRALAKMNSELRSPLKKAGFLTRDSRAVERKKYGQRGARARFQFSKR